MLLLLPSPPALRKSNAITTLAANYLFKVDRLTYKVGLEQERLAKDYITEAKLTLNSESVECITEALFADMMTAKTAYDMTDPYWTTALKFFKRQPNDLTKIIFSSPIEMASHLKELE